MKIEHWTLRQWHWLFLVGIALVVLVHAVDLLVGRPFWVITRATYMGHENNIPTWYSAGILFAAGVYAFMCYRTAALKRVKPRLGWLMLAFMLVGLSCDEVSSLHESVGGLLSRKLAPETTEQMKHTAWPLVLGPVVLGMAVAMIWILYSHLRGAFGAGMLMLSGVIVLLGCAVGLEMTINWLNHEELQWLWDIQVIVEEGGEFLGAWLIGMGLIKRHEIYASVALPAQAGEKSAVRAMPVGTKRPAIA